jgi:hypothetical protein
LNELQADTKLRYLLMSLDQNYLRPQKHDKERIRPLINITYITSLVEVKDTAKNDKNSIQKDDQLQLNETQKSN